jgi:hypothetical protein
MGLPGKARISFGVVEDCAICRMFLFRVCASKLDTLKDPRLWGR